MRQSRSFARSAAGNQKINSGLDLPCHQVAQGRFVDGAVLTERSYESGTASTKLHENKITRMGGLAKPLHSSVEHATEQLCSELKLDQPVRWFRQDREFRQFAAHHGHLVTSVKPRTNVAIFVNLIR